VKPISQMSQLELAAYVDDHLRQQGIDVVLSGGSVVSLYSHNLYVSKDVDLINTAFTRRPKLRRAMEILGFKEHGRHYLHPESHHIVEFPEGPLSVGEEPVKEIREITFDTGVLRVISPTDCVKDRLCAFYFWEDFQALEQAVLVFKQNQVELSEVERWSQVEGKSEQFKRFKDRIDTSE
jgi:phosphorylcholine metabolism protein LicD